MMNCLNNMRNLAMIKHSSFFLLLVNLIIGIGCDNSTTGPSPGDLVIGTDKSFYSQREFITFSLINGDESSVFFWFCGPALGLTIEKRVNDSWKLYDGTWCLGEWPVYNKELATSTFFVDSIRINKEGTYRLLIPFDFIDKPRLRGLFVSDEIIVR